MAYTSPILITDGDPITDDAPQSFRSGILELQGNYPSAVTTWTTGTISGLTKGSGTETAQYIRIGPMVFCYWTFTFGASSAVTGDVILTLPVTSTATNSIHGTATLTDTGTAVYKGFVQGASTTTAHIRVMNVGATYPTSTVLSSTIPFTWNTSTDVMACSFTYLAAAVNP
jgi:hypothetical protein